ncbi:MAG: ABC transporter permease [Fusicatenibacter sp.]|nr:ABC transporter permease [Lachnospiraceae bacterium]MDY2938934.1 ABC transporter permease [Fusicatenibacter sp.]
MKYFLKKLGTLILTLLIVSLLSFVAFSVIPGDAALSRLGTEATPEQVAALQKEMGLDRPLPVRYASWLSGFVTGDLGESYSYSMPVTELLKGKIPITVALTVMAFLMILAVSIPLGIFTASHAGGHLDRFLMIVNQIFMSVPGFFIGILITYFFGLLLKWFQPGSYVSISQSFTGFLHYLIAPAVAIALPRCAMGVKMLRSSIISQLDADYVRTAYSRGNQKWRVLYRHVLKNALIPVLTFWGMTIADIVANSIILEQVFTIPGMGTLLVTSISNRDYPVVQGILMLIAALVIIINFLVDLLYSRIDPRIRLKA